MHHHSTGTFLRYAGLVIGVILFLFMAYRSEQTTNNPDYVNGKRSQQQIEASAGNYSTQPVPGSLSMGTVDTAPVSDTAASANQSANAQSANQSQSSQEKLVKQSERAALKDVNSKALNSQKQDN